MKVTVVIPAYNEERYLGACLESLVQQHTTHDFDVIVVDNASTDATVSIAKSFGKVLHISVISEPIKGRGKARHTGCRAATGTVILSTDSDTILPSNWVEEFTNAITNTPYVAATGAALIKDCSPWTNTMFNFFFPWCIRFNALIFGHVGLSGFSFSVRKDIYFAAGEFDPAADAYEDLELAMRIHTLGKILFLSSPRPIFSGRRFKNGFMKGWWEYIRSFTIRFILRKRHVTLSSVK
jgi:glycosyltransferase involved in cell wall biosynthesis